jgi:hypothetical protein
MDVCKTCGRGPTKSKTKKKRARPVCGVYCDQCQGFFHAECVKLTTTDVEVLSKTRTKWFCSVECQAVSGKELDHLASEIAAIKASDAETQKVMADLENVNTGLVQHNTKLVCLFASFVLFWVRMIMILWLGGGL